MRDRIFGASEDSPSRQQTDADRSPAADEPRGGRQATTEGAPRQEAEQRGLELVEEELQATRQEVDAGVVTIRKEVVTENRTIEVPVQREDVVVERRSAGDAPGDPTATTAERREVPPGETIRVPVLEEEVRVEKVPVVTEEVVVGKRTAEEQQEVSGTIGREVLAVETEGQAVVTTEVKEPAREPAVGTAPAKSMSRPIAVAGIGAGSAAAIAAGVGAGWLYRRWRREQNRPSRRLRAQARRITSEVQKRLPDPVDLGQRVLNSSWAGAVGTLLAGLALGWMLRWWSGHDSHGGAEGRLHTTNRAAGRIGSRASARVS